MENTTTAKKKAGRPPKKVETSKKTAIEVQKNETPIVEQTPIKKAENTKIKKDIPLTTLVECRNATHGQLVYISKRTLGYEIIWNSFGDTEWLELSELVSLRNIYPRFFRDAWLIIEDPTIIEYLGLQKYYENIINIDDFDSIFNLTPEELTEKLSNIPKGMKETVIQRAREMYASGELDSVRRIEAIEKVFNIELRL